MKKTHHAYYREVCLNKKKYKFIWFIYAHEHYILYKVYYICCFIQHILLYVHNIIMLYLMNR